MTDSPDSPPADSPATARDDASAAAAPTPPAEAPKPPTVGELRRERRRLWDQREQAVYHAGGLVVDLRRRGIEDLDLVNGRADAVLDIDARLNQIDAALAQIDSRRRSGPPVPPAGYCLSCGAPFQHDAAFCFRCGARVLVPVDHQEGEPAGGDQPTAVIDDSELER